VTDNYYERTETRNTDGTPLFAKNHDKRNEVGAASILEKAWACTFHPFGNLTPCDYYIVKHERMVGIAEIKSHPYLHDKYSHIWLNVRKWMSMTNYENGLDCPAIFVARFSDMTGWIYLRNIDATKHVLGGTKKRVKSHTDHMEPVIKVPRDSDGWCWILNG